MDDQGKLKLDRDLQVGAGRGKKRVIGSEIRLLQVANDSVAISYNMQEKPVGLSV